MSHLAKSPVNTGHGGARTGAGRPSQGKKGVTLRLTPEQHHKLLALGGSKWVINRLDELDDKPVFVFRESPVGGWSMDIVPGYQLSMMQEAEALEAVPLVKTTVFSEKAEARAFIRSHRYKFKDIAKDWLALIKNAKV